MRKTLKVRGLFKIFDACKSLDCTHEDNKPFQVTFYTSSEISQGEVRICYFASISDPELVGQYGKNAILHLNDDDSITTLQNPDDGSADFWNNVGVRIRAVQML